MEVPCVGVLGSVAHNEVIGAAHMGPSSTLGGGGGGEGREGAIYLAPTRSLPLNM